MAKILNNLFNSKTMTSDLMTLRDLRVQTFKERKKGRLTKLSNNFYAKLGNLEEQINYKGSIWKPLPSFEKVIEIS